MTACDCDWLRLCGLAEKQNESILLRGVTEIRKRTSGLAKRSLWKQESRAVARKPRDAAVVLFGLKFADNIHYKFKSSQASKAKLQELQTYRRKTEFNAKWPFRVIQGHVF